MSTGILCFSRKGEELSRRIVGSLGQGSISRCGKGELASWTRQHFETDDLLIYVGACGIAVRAIAPYVASKTADPAVLVVDETGKYVISLLSGHLGGANAWCSAVASAIGAEPVITTATDRNGVFAVDEWARQHGFVVRNTHKIVEISSALLAGKTVEIHSDFPICGELPEGVVPGEKGFFVSCFAGEGLRVIPRILTLGIGCRKGISEEKVEAAYDRMLALSGICPEAICKICSVDLKAEEPGLMALAERLGIPFECFSSQQLRQVPGEFSASPFVQSVVGVDNVCERSAVLGSGGKLIMKKQVLDGVTMALAMAPCTISF